MRTGARGTSRRAVVTALALLLVGGIVAAVEAPVASAKSSGPQVLYVGTFNGITTPAAQTFPTIQMAVDAAKKGDWILVAPGDYHETADVASPPTASELQTGWYGGVDIETPGLHLRGMDRNSVVVDGTLSTAATPCSSNPADQNTLGGEGRNGIMVWKAAGVSIENLTVCNFLSGSGYSGNEIWWNGGGNLTGKIGLKGYSGGYLTATSTYFSNDDPAGLNVCHVCALYGIFASASKGPGSLSNLYANNFSDSGIYVGACSRICNVTIDNAVMEDNALGYSGTNSGGSVVVTNSLFDNNKDGFDTNTALTGDPPPPQDGRCPGKATGPIPSSPSSCWVFEHNVVESNNNPNVPISGTAGLGPTGTGMTVSGGRNDVILDNQFIDNGAWGVLFVPYPDGNTTSNGKTCTGTKGIVATGLGIPGVSCLYDPMGDWLDGNQFTGNGSFGNPSNADYGNLLITGNEPTNCFSGNTDAATVSGAASAANVIDGFSAQTPSACGSKTPKAGLLDPTNTDSTLLVQVECDAGVLSGASCSAAHYPQPTGVVMHPLPANLPSMNPCSGSVPANLWCVNGAPAAAKKP